MTKGELVKALDVFNDDDEVIIDVHDYTAQEDHYNFYVDYAKLDKGVEIQLTVLPN